MGDVNWLTVGEPYDPARDSVVHAQFNAAYSFARALADGRVDLETYQKPAIRRSAHRRADARDESDLGPGDRPDRDRAGAREGAAQERPRVEALERHDQGQPAGADERGGARREIPRVPRIRPRRERSRGGDRLADDVASLEKPTTPAARSWRRSPRRARRRRQAMCRTSRRISPSTSSTRRQLELSFKPIQRRSSVR